MKIQTITLLGKWLVEKKLLHFGFCIEAVLFILTGALLGFNIFLSFIALIFSLFVAFSVGEGIKYQSISEKEVKDV
jgi:hypothetical protein